MPDGRPVTHAGLKAELAVQKTDVETALVTLEERLTVNLTASMGQMGTQLEDRLTENLTATMRQIETNLLTAFHSYSQGQTARLHTIDVVDQELRIRMSALEDRVLALETRRPPV